jgi:6-phosphogluconolactonase (cycloisomerase 2 family)
VSDPYGGTVYGYSINDTTGALTEAGNPLTAGTQPSVVEIDPSGKFAYVASYATSNISAYPIEAYSIDAATGALTAVPGTPFVAGFFGGILPARVVISN